jgi:hypothetical protein
MIVLSFHIIRLLNQLGARILTARRVATITTTSLLYKNIYAIYPYPMIIEKESIIQPFTYCDWYSSEELLYQFKGNRAIPVCNSGGLSMKCGV